MNNYTNQINSAICDSFEIETGVSNVNRGAVLGQVPAIQITLSKNGWGQVVGFEASMLPALIAALQAIEQPSAEVIAAGNLAKAKFAALETLSACVDNVKNDTRDDVRNATSVAKVLIACANPKLVWDNTKDWETLYRTLQVLA